MARQLDSESSAWIGTALAYVPHVARRYVGCGLPFDELLAVGNLGLVEAALRFQPSRNVKFVTYADWWIRKSILKALEEQAGPVRLPRYKREQLRSLQRARRDLRSRKGAEPSVNDLAQEAGISGRDVERLRTLGGSAVSLDDTYPPGSDRPLSDVLAVSDADGPDDAVVHGDLVRHLHGLVDRLAEKERSVVRLRFGLNGRSPMTLRAIGSELGISRERVRQLERRALLQLKNLL